jgi:hypothetical protein
MSNFIITITPLDGSMQPVTAFATTDMSQVPPDRPPGPPGRPTFPIWGPPGVEFPPIPGYPPVAGHPLPPIPPGEGGGEPPELPAPPQFTIKWIYIPGQGWVWGFAPVEGTAEPKGGEEDD